MLSKYNEKAKIIIPHYYRNISVSPILSKIDPI